MSDTQKIRIVHGDEAKAHLADPELIQLTNRVNNVEVEKTVGALRHDAAMRVYRELWDQGKHEEARRSAMEIDPKIAQISHMKMLRERGDIAVAKEDEKTVGMVGFEQKKHLVDGRTIYEIRRLGVVKEYEGRGIGGQLQRAMFDRVREQDSEGIILVETEQPAVRAICQKMGFRPCTLEEGLHYKLGDVDDEDRAYYAKTAATFFIFDPKTQPSS